MGAKNDILGVALEPELASVFISTFKWCWQ